ncbi:hypothetical protein [Prochlorococcus marinus]|uniref:Uncharacterized protein n=1 Tax=Prochlorococcus marinus (strain MIT 9211) TaxID=93059 RepID=A9BA86_PROM4|nr:hypothetical protein [Prochlorococcus marinus]ABX08748.1 Hypothetical protein P9211_08171 [Prochlorococcus marinus str. MIT 9211]
MKGDLLTEKSTNRILTPERASFYIPIITSASLSIILLFSLVVPFTVNMNKTYYELKEYKRKKLEYSKLENQYAIINSKYNQLSSTKNQIITLLAGENSLDTLLAKINTICSNNFVQIVSLKPGKIERYVAPVPTPESKKSKRRKSRRKKKSNTKKVLSTKLDPFLSEGIEKYSADLVLSASFNNILEFIRDLENMENIILTKDLSFTSDSVSSDDDTSLLNIQFKIIAYGKQLRL